MIKNRAKSKLIASLVLEITRLLLLVIIITLDLQDMRFLGIFQNYGFLL